MTKLDETIRRLSSAIKTAVEIIEEYGHRESTEMGYLIRALEDHSGQAITLIRTQAKALEAADDILKYGINGGNNVRLCFIAAGQHALKPDALEQAQKSEDAVQRYRKARQALKTEG